MYEDLLFIIKNLLNQIESLNFKEDEKEQVLTVIRKAIFILLVELRQ